MSDKHIFHHTFWDFFKVPTELKPKPMNCRASVRELVRKASPPHSNPGLCQISVCITTAWCKQKFPVLDQWMGDLSCKGGEDERVKPLSAHSNRPKLETPLETHISKELLPKAWFAHLLLVHPGIALWRRSTLSSSHSKEQTDWDLVQAGAGWWWICVHLPAVSVYRAPALLKHSRVMLQFGPA